MTLEKSYVYCLLFLYLENIINFIAAKSPKGVPKKLFKRQGTWKFNYSTHYCTIAHRKLFAPLLRSKEINLKVIFLVL